MAPPSRTPPTAHDVQGRAGRPRLPQPFRLGRLSRRCTDCRYDLLSFGSIQSKTSKKGDDLFTLSEGLEQYRGFYFMALPV